MVVDLTSTLGPGCPELDALSAHIEAGSPSRAAALAVGSHLTDPTAPAVETAATTAVSLDDVRAAYRFLREDREVRAFIGSMFYPHRLLYRFAESTVGEFSADLGRLQRLMTGRPVLSRTVEIHPSKGTCNYGCVMCLWSDKRSLTYATQGLQANGLLTTSDWTRLLDELRAGGVEALVLSGGGEVLLNRDVVTILQRARSLNFRVSLYTTGFNLAHASQALWAELVRIERLRLSIHSPLATTYDRITGLPTRLGALRRVVEQTARLLALRRELGGSVRVGIGFVIQPLNYEQILPMAQFAAELGVDFLDIRKDEVDVTVGLSADQLRSVAEQLASLRARALDGRYGATAMDLSDELVALTNGRPYIRRRGGECMAKYFRPTISPFGILAPCDLKAEPRFASSQFNLGSVGANRVLPVVDSMPARFIPNACEECMPSSRTGNAVYAKVLGDQRAGVGLEEQPFVSAFTTGGGNRWPRGV